MIGEDRPSQHNEPAFREAKSPADARFRAWWIAGGYAVVATLWIYFSDLALEALIVGPELLLRISVFKGLAFVTLTTVLLLLVMRRAFGAIQDGYETLKSHKAEIERLNRLYAALSQINQAIVKCTRRDGLFHRTREALVKYGGFGMAWIAWHDPETGRLAPAGTVGEEAGSPRFDPVDAIDSVDGESPAARAFREERPVVINDFLSDSASFSWKKEARRKGVRAGAAFPVRLNGKVVGTLNVFAMEAGFFQDREIGLLTEAAADVSFALDNLAREEERQRAETLARNEKLFSDSMIESMPGIIYFYEEHGGFLRWNRNFETVSGYSAEEIAGMHPLEFFRPEDQPLIRSRIAEVFSRGESSVEAPFRAKDGALTPYFFTGRSVTYDGKPCLVGMGIDVSERQRAEQALRESEQRHRATLDNVLEGCQLVDFDGRYLYLNEAAAQHNRRPNSELLGRTMKEAWPGIEQTRVYALIDRCLRERTPAREEVAFDFADGTKGWFDMRVRSAEEGVLLLSIDRTERKLAEERLIESERKYRELVENANSIILRWNAEGRVTLLNDFGQRFFGYAAEEILGRHVLGTIVPESESGGRDLQRLMDDICGDPAAFEHNVNENMRRNGERVWISWTNRVVIDDAGRLVEILSIGTDISKQRKAEHALAVLNETLELEVAERTAELKAALVRAEAADRLKSAFLATMSHELRTPLNSIIGFTGILLQELAGPLNPEQAKQLGMVRGSARHLLELINDVLDISKIEAGQLEVRAEPFDPVESIQRVVASIRPLAEKKGLELVAELPSPAPKMSGDRRRMEQILLNLLNNALKFTEQGGVALTADTVADFRRDPDAPARPALRVRVKDTGVGIKPDELALLFQPFRQLDTGLTRQHEGTGLGLAICQRLAELMGGSISVDSEWSKGSEFTVVLPLNPVSKT